MNENPLAESAAYWNEIILGNKSQSERCNNLPANHKWLDGPEMTTVCRNISIVHFTCTYIVGVCMAAVGFGCFKGLKGCSMVLCAYAVQLL